MKSSELLARIVITMAIFGVIGTPLFFWAHTPLIHARLAENGGWSPDVLHGRVGEPLVLHLTSDDVTHGFAVAGMPMQSVDVLPGKVTEITLTFDKPGTYTFYCTRGCGNNYSGMIGTIEVTGLASHSPVSASPPLYVTLGLDLDVPHNSPVLPTGRPSSLVGQSYEVPIFPMLQPSNLPIYRSPEYYRSHSPYATWQFLRANPSLSQRDDQQIWAMVAYIWQSNTTPTALVAGSKRFAQDCAACHGETAAGNGVYASELKASGTAAAHTPPGATTGTTMQGPADFTNVGSMLGASPALLQGKILRGGMGTGMPSWEPILTEQQIWDLVAYLYSFQFEYHW